MLLLRVFVEFKSLIILRRWGASCVCEGGIAGISFNWWSTSLEELLCLCIIVGHTTSTGMHTVYSLSVVDTVKEVSSEPMKHKVKKTLSWGLPAETVLHYHPYLGHHIQRLAR